MLTSKHQRQERVLIETDLPLFFGENQCIAKVAGVGEFQVEREGHITWFEYTVHLATRKASLSVAYDVTFSTNSMMIASSSIRVFPTDIPSIKAISRSLFYGQITEPDV